MDKETLLSAFFADIFESPSCESSLRCGFIIESTGTAGTVFNDGGAGARGGGGGGTADAVLGAGRLGRGIGGAGQGGFVWLIRTD